jgi:transposase-like protein
MKILDPNLKGKIVKESYKEGVTVVSLSKKYGVSTSAIHRWRQSSNSEEKIEGK